MFQRYKVLPFSVNLIRLSTNFNFRAPIFFAPKSRSEAKRARAAGKMPEDGKNALSPNESFISLNVLCVESSTVVHSVVLVDEFVLSTSCCSFSFSGITICQSSSAVLDVIEEDESLAIDDCSSGVVFAGAELELMSPG